MLLALDVGNTNIVIGFLDESGIRNIARLETDRDKTAHEYAISLRQVIEFSGIAPEQVDGAILSSVVPPINGALVAAVRMITGIRPLVVGPGMKTGLNIALDNPATMGSDLVVGAAAALAMHAPPLIIIDMGTATTMTVIDREARVLGGAIIPGVGISLEALASGTSQLPHISLDAPKKCISTDTIEAMRSGSVYGTAAMLDGMIERMEDELGESATVIATGGLGGIVYITAGVSVWKFENGVAGFGFLALAVMIFGAWHPLKIALAALLFGFCRALGNVYSGFYFLLNMNIPSVVYNMLPYIISLVVLAFTSKKSRAPKAEGIPYDKGSR